MDAQVRFQRGRAGTSGGRSVRVPTGSSLSEAIALAGLPLASACGRDGICGRCGVAVLVGASTLAAETEDDLRIKARNRIDPNLRLACRTRVTADLEVTASYW